MQVGLMAPQGWKGEYDGWQPADAWARTVELATNADALGFESLWVFDHFHTVPAPTDEITFESFSVLSALAMATSRVRLGHMVVCTGFRNPGPDGQAVVDDRRHQRRPVRARHRGRLEGRGVAGVRLRLPDARRADGGVRRPPRGDPGDAPPGAGELRGPVRARPRRDQRAKGPPGAAHPDHRRGQRRAGHGRATPSAMPTSSTSSSCRPTSAPRGCAQSGNDARPRIATRPRSGSRCTRATRRCATWVRPGSTRSPGSQEIGLDRIVCFPARWAPTVEAQERFAEDVQAAGIELAVAV